MLAVLASPLLLLLVACSDGPEPSAEASSLPSRLVSIEEYQVLDEQARPSRDGAQLNLIIDSCRPENIDVDLVESEDRVVVTLNEVVTPASAEGSGESRGSSGCQGALAVPLASPLADRAVIDGTTDQDVPRLG